MAGHDGRTRRILPLAAFAALAGCIPQVARPDPRGARHDTRDESRETPRDAPWDVPRDRPQADEDDAPPRDDARAPPAAPSVWQARAVAADARTIEEGSHIVRPGETLRAIGDKTGAGSDAIARANGIPPPFVIRAGQRLRIPGGRYHMVRAGQTGIGIARAYGIDWSRVVTANRLSEPYTLRVGMRVLIPDAGPATSLADRAAAFRLDVDDIVTGGEPALASNERPVAPTRSSRRILPSTAAIVTPAQLRGGFGWPVRGRIVARFGPGASGEKFNGIKIAVPLDTPILAAADGVVAYAGNEIANLGGLVIIKHGDGWATVYGHASRLLVRRGQSVKRGQTIAMSGDSGFADRPELHFELRKGRTPVDPLRQLPRS